MFCLQWFMSATCMPTIGCKLPSGIGNHTTSSARVTNALDPWNISLALPFTYWQCTFKQKFYFDEIQFILYFYIFNCAFNAKTKNIVTFKDRKAYIIFVYCNPYVFDTAEALTLTFRSLINIVFFQVVSDRGPASLFSMWIFIFLKRLCLPHWVSLELCWKSADHNMTIFVPHILSS